VYAGAVVAVVPGYSHHGTAAAVVESATGTAAACGVVVVAHKIVNGDSVEVDSGSVAGTAAAAAVVAVVPEYSRLGTSGAVESAVGTCAVSRLGLKCCYD